MIYLLPISSQKDKNRANFKQSRNLEEEEQIRIIREGFQLTSERQIDLKHYFEGDGDPNTLSWRKGYKLKYESVRRSPLYRKLKEENLNNFSNYYN